MRELDTTLVPAERFFSLSQEKSQFSDPSPEGDFFEKIAEFAYGGLDKIFGRQSMMLSKKDVLIPQPYKRILEFLHGKGIVSRVHLNNERFNDAPYFNIFTIYGKYDDIITDGKKNIKPYGLVVLKDPKELFSKALGEFLERYFTTIYKKKNLLAVSPRELKRKNVPYLDLKNAGNLGFHFTDRHQRPWNEDDIFFWEKATRLSTGETARVPAQLVYWNYILSEDPPEPRLQESNTNGAGGMFTAEEATLNALYELIQRDAFLVHWLLAISPPKVDPDSVPDDAFQRILKESRRYGFKMHCLNTTLDTGIPSFNVVLIDESKKGPSFAIGGGCEADPAKAIAHAAKEAWGIYYWMRWDGALEKNFRLPDNYRPFADPMVDQKNRARLWSKPEMIKHGEFFFSGPAKKLREYAFTYPINFATKGGELKEAVSRVEALGPGYETYAVLVRHPILTKLGYHVARVIVPKLVPLYLHENYAPVNAVRIQEIARKIGRQNNNLNTIPHPFA